MNSKIVFIYMVFLMMGVVVFNGTVVQAAVIHVTTTEDNVPGSLRTAISIANANNKDNTLIIPAGTYFLSGAAGDDTNTSGDLDINTSRNLTIIGAGKTNTDIDGNGIDRVLHILNGTVSFTDLTIKKGISPGSGGGIYNCANLTLTRCVIRENAAADGGSFHGDYGYPGDPGGGIYNEGVLTLDKCIISLNKAGDGGEGDNEGGNGGSGGGIHNTGMLTLNKCTITGNSSGSGGWDGGIDGDGGGVCNNGTLTMNGCTVSYNAGQYGRGGGICNNAYLTLTNCTISKNDAGNGGGLYNVGNSQSISVTLVDNAGSGIFNEGSISLKNSLVANNWGYYGYGPDCAGIFNWVCYSLIEDTSGCTLTGFQKNNILGKDPVLGPLQDNGGPTYTHALLPGSPAIDAGSSPDLSEDQRGSTRPFDIPGIANVSDGADIGAYEFKVYYAISGGITYGGTGLPGVTLTFSNNGGSTTTNPDGNYSRDVLYYWSGTVTPVKEGYTFIPSSRDYTAVTGNLSHQDYTAVSIIPPQISLNRIQLYFGADTSGKQTGPQSFLISNSGGGFLNWTATANTSDPGWLNCNPAAGTGSALVTVSINPSGLLPGTYQGTITVADPHAMNSPQAVNVTLTMYDAGSTNLPFGSFDTPIDGAVVMGSIPVTGWALDNLGIESVKIYRDPAAGEGSGLIYIGAALMVEGARPDIEAANPGYPNNYKAGWGYMMLTNFLSNQGNGTYTLYANAVDKEGNLVNLGTKTIYGDNVHAMKPFGAIDTPAQGGAASGSNYMNYGWALTPLPNTIPIDGSTLTVWVDGVPLGHPVYNENRPDVAALFPAYNNSAGAGGHYHLDTTAYENGVHTIAWSATDNAGHSDGIGSRYFTIQNLRSDAAQKSAASVSGVKCLVLGERTSASLIGNTSAVTEFIEIALDSSQPISFQKGYNEDIEDSTLYPDKNGILTLEIEELERIVIYLGDERNREERKAFNANSIKDIHLTPNTQHLTLKNTPSTYYYGYLSIGNQLKPLPIGSTLDAERGVFYWQPGPGFLGDYELVFIEKSNTGEKMKKHIIIRIAPHSG